MNRAAAAAMAGVFLAAVDQTVAATALPTITGELGEPALYAWVLTAYLMATTALGPIAGSLGDTHGRRPLLAFGALALGVGSALAGSAGSMGALVASRALQGVGAGALTSGAFALLGDVYAGARMARATGIMSAVYGLAGAVGPVVGGALCESVGWRWIFWGQAPLCAAIAWVLLRTAPRSERAAGPVDVAGALLLTAALLPALALIGWVGEGAGAGEPRVLGAAAAALIFGALFAAAERRATRPIVELRLFRRAAFSWAMAAMFAVAVGMYAALSFTPQLLQERLGLSPSAAGLTMAPLVLTLALTAGLAGRALGRGAGPRALASLGVAIAALGLAGIGALAPGSSASLAAAMTAIVGTGLGLTMPTLLLAAQGAAPPEHLGVTTALAKSMRAIGGLIGVAAAGAAIRGHAPARGLSDALALVTLESAAVMGLALLVTLGLPGRRVAA